MKNKIVMLPRELLVPHPDNPRKDLGDLSELKESIRAHGVMQNLTVIPEEDGDGYRILIGHRRYAASEGVLNELPCVVATGLTNREQVGIMLVENMQRSDLTYIEQAHGFQMMMDLGDTVETIAEKTGFSKATVKHRLAINELDPEALKEAREYFQPTLNDFIALEKVKDVDKKNEILRDAESSRDIQEQVKDYLDELKEQENFEYYKKFFEEAGWIDETKKNQWFYYQDGFKHVDGQLDRFDIMQKLLPEDEVKALMAKIKGEVHFGLCYHAIMVRTYKEPKANKTVEAEQKKAKELEALKKKNKAALKEVRAQICDAIMDFIQTSQMVFPDEKRELSSFYVLLDIARAASVTLYNLTPEKVKYQYNDKVSLKDYNKSTLENYFVDYLDWTPFFQLLANVWWSMAASYNSFEDYDLAPHKDRLSSFKTLLDLLSDVGEFHIDDEWLPVLDGSSELYKKDGK